MEDFLSSEEERERAWRGLPSMIGSRLQFEGRREPTTDCRLLEALDAPLSLPGYSPKEAAKIVRRP